MLFKRLQAVWSGCCSINYSSRLLTLLLAGLLTGGCERVLSRHYQGALVSIRQTPSRMITPDPVPEVRSLYWSSAKQRVIDTYTRVPVTLELPSGFLEKDDHLVIRMPHRTWRIRLTEDTPVQSHRRFYGFLKPSQDVKRMGIMGSVKFELQMAGNGSEVQVQIRTLPADFLAAFLNSPDFDGQLKLYRVHFWNRKTITRQINHEAAHRLQTALAEAVGNGYLARAYAIQGGLAEWGLHPDLLTTAALKSLSEQEPSLNRTVVRACQAWAKWQHNPQPAIAETAEVLAELMPLAQRCEHDPWVQAAISHLLAHGQSAYTQVAHRQSVQSFLAEVTQKMAENAILNWDEPALTRFQNQCDQLNAIQSQPQLVAFSNALAAVRQRPAILDKWQKSDYVSALTDYLQIYTAHPELTAELSRLISSHARSHVHVSGTRVSVQNKLFYRTASIAFSVRSTAVFPIERVSCQLRVRDGQGHVVFQTVIHDTRIQPGETRRHNQVLPKLFNTSGVSAAVQVLSIQPPSPASLAIRFRLKKPDELQGGETWTNVRSNLN